MNPFDCAARAKGRCRFPRRWAGGLALLVLWALALSTPVLVPVEAKASSQGGDVYTTPGFATPEEAIGHFCQGLAAQDFQGALEACAISEQAEGFDFPGWVDRMKAHVPLANPAPATSGLYKELNEAAIAGSFAGQIKMLLYSFFVTAGLEGSSVAPADRAYALEFQEAVAAEQLAGLRLLRVDPPKKAVLESEKNRENFARMAEIYGAQEMTERIVLYELGGRTFLGGFGLYRYGSGWKICRLHSSLAGLSPTGAAVEASPEEYAGML